MSTEASTRPVFSPPRGRTITLCSSLGMLAGMRAAFVMLAVTLRANCAWETRGSCFLAVDSPVSGSGGVSRCGGERRLGSVHPAVSFAGKSSPGTAMAVRPSRWSSCKWRLGCSSFSRSGSYPVSIAVAISRDAVMVGPVARGRWARRPAARKRFSVVVGGCGASTCTWRSATASSGARASGCYPRSWVLYFHVRARFRILSRRKILCGPLTDPSAVLLDAACTEESRGAKQSTGWRI